MTKRPCSICRRWFERDPRAGKRHAVCDSEACQRERNRRACSRWRSENPEKVVAARLRRRLPAEPPPSAEVLRLQPMRHFDAAVLRHVVGAEMQVVLDEVSKVILAAARHVVLARPVVHPMEFQRVLPSAARHETAGARAPP